MSRHVTELHSNEIFVAYIAYIASTLVKWEIMLVHHLNKYQILVSLRFASTEERVTRSSKQMKCGWDHLIRGIFLFIFVIYI